MRRALLETLDKWRLARKLRTRHLGFYSSKLCVRSLPQGPFLTFGTRLSRNTLTVKVPFFLLFSVNKETTK